MIRHIVEPGPEKERGAGGLSFEDLVWPIKPEQFFADVWQKEIFWAQRSAGTVTPMIDMDQFLLSIFEVEVGAAEVLYTHPSQPNRRRAMDAFWRLKTAWQKPPSLDQLASELDAGTLIFNGIDQHVPSARDWCQQMFRATGCWTSVQAVFGAGQGASAAGVHSDGHDIFVLQTQGTKDWLMWETPGRSHVRIEADAQAPDLPADQTVRLTPGDVLYVPKRGWHWPQTVGQEPSLHMTATLFAPTPGNVMDWLSATLSKHVVSERPLPFSRFQPESPAQSEDLEEAIALLRSELAGPDTAQRAATYMTLASAARMFKGGKR